MRCRFILLALISTLLGVGCEARHGPAEAQEPVARPATEGTAVKVGMCSEHGVPEALCTKCNPALIPVFKSRGDWCEAHGFPESFCPTCSPNAKLPDVGSTPEAAADWCGGHAVPESSCTKCNPALIKKFQAAGDWCPEHGFPESVCPVCNPQAPPSTASAADWCLEHGLPESKCTKCNTGLVSQYKASGDWCGEHGFPESVCPVCAPQAAPDGAEQAAIEMRVVSFDSPGIEDAAGIRTVPARRVEVAPSLECTARIAFHGDRIADVRTLVPGVIRKIHAPLGARVELGAALFELESTRVGDIQAALHIANVQLRTTRANLARQRTLRKGGIASQRQVEVARQALAAARAQSKAARAALRIAGAEQEAPSGRYTLTAPLAGTLVRRPAVLGLLATESTSLATIADTTLMWALCDVAEGDAARLALGQSALVTVHQVDDSTHEGTITWIASEVDPRARTVAARVELPNPDGHLRANQFARGRIETGSPRWAVAVPREAIQRVGEREVVFVRNSAGSYQPRVVRRHGGGDLVQVEGGVRAGDAVVTTGAVLLRTEIMPGSIGAGCCEIEPRGHD
jgi:cobalt-zinc-cadmium efflux system membrane fusion protein